MASFSERCYATISDVPKGKVTTYADVAHALGCKAYRAVGHAMNKNPYAPFVPCHRVVCSNGRVGGFARGTKEKIEMLRAEGVVIEKGVINLSRYRHAFDRRRP